MWLKVIKMTELERDIRRFVIPVLRRASLRFKLKNKTYPRTTAKQNARVERGLYKCASCGELFKEKDTVVDHVDPVVPLTGDEYDWNDFINRLFVTADKLQILCNPCHDVKSLVEDGIRFAGREKEREEEKEEKKRIKAEKKLAKQKKVE